MSIVLCLMSNTKLYTFHFEGFMELKKLGKAKSIGVSNFAKSHIQALLDAELEKPAVNQFEIHPLHRQVPVIYLLQGAGLSGKSILGSRLWNFVDLPKANIGSMVSVGTIQILVA